MLAMLDAEDLKNHFFLDIYFKGKYPVGAFRYLEEHNMAPVIEEGDMVLLRQKESWISWELTITQANAFVSRMQIRMS